VPQTGANFRPAVLAFRLLAALSQTSGGQGVEGKKHGFGGTGSISLAARNANEIMSGNPPMHRGYRCCGNGGRLVAKRACGLRGSRVTGRLDVEDVLGQILSEFCIGK
jgi:hypothetical protein